jgi:4-diphosphocytidyl-2-C-methyl-D-erythritol kinase
MVTFPPCKINLGLHILSKQPDGYHSLETCFYPVPWTDILEIIPSSSFSFTSTGLEIAGNAEDNLCVKAYRMLQKDFRLGKVAIHLHKILPSGAGLGGGSSDAASTLLLLNSIFDLRLTGDRLKSYAAQLGSDCAFFIDNKPMIGVGRGEQLHETEITLAGKFLVLIKPDIHVSTAEAYSAVVPKMPEQALRNVLAGGIQYWRENLVNDFEVSVFARYPQIGEAKKRMYELGAQYASMSGSGSSVFGIFDHAVNLKTEFPSATYWAGVLTE